ncbi:MAG TPA: hypothetical protein PL099_05320 [Thermoclostridium caenicola]|nr:hypothetical protein [Thermoclostridium caenicola]
MKKRHIGMIAAWLLIFIMTGAVIVLADENNPTVSAGEILDHDFIVEGYSVTNDGTIRGDLLSFSQRLTVRGYVEGDIIAFASDIFIGGEVGGSLRLAGSSIIVASRVARNVMLIGSGLVLDKGSVVLKNAYLMGDTVKSLGTVEGTITIYGTDVTLGGVYNGDVTVHMLGERASLNILQDTVINGKLTYIGANAFTPPSYARVKDYEYIKVSPSESSSRMDVMAVVKRLATLTVYYLFALLLFRLFPRFFVRSGDFIAKSPLATAGVGMATLGTFVGGLLILLILILLVMTILDKSILGFTGLVFLFFGLMTILFADLPVSLWLGGKIAGKTDSVPARLAAGLVTIQAAKLILKLLGGLPSVGPVFSALGFMVNAAVWLLGTGAIVKTLFSMLKAANRQADAEAEDFSLSD